MAKLDDLSPKLKLQTAEIELMLNTTELSVGQSAGGLSLYSSSFKRGYGDAVFGADVNGIWLGAADFVDAPFKVDMEGNMTATSLDLSAYVSKAGTDQTLTGDIKVGNGNVKIDGANKRILINDGSCDIILIGYQSGGF